MIILKNKGEMDIDVIKTMGVNIKDCSNSIGYFGTGLKYAIAIFLRENIDFFLFIGDMRFEFFTESKTIRGKHFDLCMMRGPHDSCSLGFTTELGKNWELWQAYREIHSNCVDENGEIFNGKVLIGDSGHTTFCIEDIDTSGIFLDQEDKQKLYSGDDIEIYEGSSDVIFYRGIKAKILDRPSKYTYNILRECTLTEDRLLCYDFQIEYAINESIAKMDGSKEEIIKSVVTSKDTYESSLRMSSNCYAAPSDTFLKVCGLNKKDVNSSVSEYVISNTPSAKLTEEERKQRFYSELEDLCSSFDYALHDDGDVITINGFYEEEK